MEYLVGDIVREARVALDQNNSSAQLAVLGDVDTLTLDEIIESKVVDAARLVESAAPGHLFDNGKVLGGIVVWSGQRGYGSGHIMLPVDFLRLLTFRMSDWHRPVTEVITADSPLYAMQSSSYGGVRGNPERPVVAIVQHGAGLALEFYSCQSGRDAAVETALYVPRPAVSGGKIDISSKLRDAIVYRVASMTAQSINEVNLAEMLLATSNALAGIEQQ